jgi:membrane associated rhomboid family serine protease
MQCAVCNNLLHELTIEGISSDSCSLCGSIWFASGSDFASAAERSARKSDLPLEDSIKSRINTEAKKSSAAGFSLNCPQCHMPMETINYADDSGIFINRCHTCTGIWIDDIKFKRITRYLKDDPLMDKAGAELAHEVKKEDATKEFALEVGKITTVDFFNVREIFTNPAEAVVFGIPLWLRNLRSIPFISISLIISCIAIYIFQISAVSDIKKYISLFGFIPATPVSFGLLTSIFIHANWFHLLGNMLFLWVFGPPIEEKLGRINFILYYLICGLCGNFAFLIMHFGSQVTLIGASGAISGIIGTCLVLDPLGTIMTTRDEAPVWLYAVAYFLIQFGYNFLLFITETHAGIGYEAHIGGFIGGVIIALILKNRLDN